MSGVYGTRTIKKRGRRTKAEMEVLSEAIYEIVAENEPATVRGIFYLASSEGVVPKTENEGYRPAQRELLKMRREEVIPWGWITDGSRSRFGYRRYGGPDSYAPQVAANYRRDYPDQPRIDALTSGHGMSPFLWTGRTGDTSAPPTI